MTVPTDILLINRDKYFLAQTAKALQEEGLTTHTATDMRGALSILSNHAVELIICDKDLQDIGGCEFLSFIKKDPLREKIPFMFFVYLNDQGRPLQAFQLGAIDYIVYPIDNAALIERINAALQPNAQKPPSATPKPIQPSQPAPSEKTQQPSIAGPVFDTPLNVEVSRDGVIWLPSKITRFTRQGLTMETPLMGKAGVTLMIRIKQPEGAFILNGLIKDISFNDFQKPAGLEIEVQADDNWRRIQAGIELDPSAHGPDDSLRNVIQNDPIKAAQAAAEPVAAGAQGPTLAAAQKPGTQSQLKESSYDRRFYQSLIGKQLDNYRAITLIGIGNMGGVLQGWDVALEREVALKIISYKLSSKETFRELFIKEARVISKLNHPNIAQIYHIGSSNEILYYAMEFIDGITLKEIIKKDGPINIQKGLTYLQTVCRALEVVYQNSIVHRDIKPANLMVSHTGVVKIVDFGVAKMHDARSGSGVKKGLFGTPLYMSPEQIAGLAIDHRSDMYSLGATFYHAFCGAPPFRADDVKTLLGHHLHSPLIPLSKKNPKIPPPLSRMIEKMMAKDPFERYDSFQQIAMEVETLQS